MSTPLPGPQGEPPTPPPEISPPGGIGDGEKQRDRENAVGVAKLTRAGAITVGVIAALVSALITAPVTVWVAKMQIDAATEKSESEFLRTQRLTAYAQVVTDLEAVFRATDNCRVAYESYDETNPPDGGQLANAALTTGSASSLSEHKAQMLASPTLESLIVDIGHLRFDSNEHCYKAVNEPNPANYPQDVGVLAQDADALAESMNNLVDAAQNDIVNNRY